VVEWCSSLLVYWSICLSHHYTTIPLHYYTTTLPYHDLATNLTQIRTDW